MSTTGKPTPFVTQAQRDIVDGPATGGLPQPLVPRMHGKRTAYAIAAQIRRALKEQP